MIITSFHFYKILSFIVLWFYFYTHLYIFRITQLDALFRKTFEVKYFVLVTYNRKYINSHAFIISVFSTYHAHFFLKYELSDPLIPSILLLPCPGLLMKISGITMYVNDNTDNSHNAFSHLYFLLHPYVVSFIIPSFMNQIFL